mmetsp:Transcript_6441/g.15641  ORF Transcript_6441/g.15641 Transcript_6441/m.15641 type:complete len:207 (+) Transcript_6441:1078-1698(+)
MLSMLLSTAYTAPSKVGLPLVFCSVLFQADILPHILRASSGLRSVAASMQVLGCIKTGGPDVMNSAILSATGSNTAGLVSIAQRRNLGKVCHSSSCSAFLTRSMALMMASRHSFPKIISVAPLSVVPFISFRRLFTVRESFASVKPLRYVLASSLGSDNDAAPAAGAGMYCRSDGHISTKPCTACFSSCSLGLGFTAFSASCKAIT